MTSVTASTLSSVSINRGDMVDLSFCALTMSLKGETTTPRPKAYSIGRFYTRSGHCKRCFGRKNCVYLHAHDSSTVDYVRKTVSLSSGKLTADVVTVNLNNPKVTVRSALVNNTIGATASFSNIVAQSGAKAAINANFPGIRDLQNSNRTCCLQRTVCMVFRGLAPSDLLMTTRLLSGGMALFYRVAVSGLTRC